MAAFELYVLILNISKDRVKTSIYIKANYIVFDA